MKTVLKTCLAICFYGIACLAVANDITMADKLYEQGRVREAMKIYMRPEHIQDSYIQNRLGNIYLKPEFKDEKKAVEWFRKSANQGNMYGQYNLGLMYKRGMGVIQDHQQAFNWFSKAAEQGNANAMNSIGILYEEGTGVEKDAVKAGNWYVEAARKGDRDAMHRLYEVYEYGKLGQPVDKAKAEEWKAKAEAAMKEQGLSRNVLMDTFRLGMEEQ